MMTNTVLQIHRQLAHARRRQRENEAQLFAALLKQGELDDEIAALQQQYIDALEAPRLAEQGGPAVAEWERMIAGEG